jgi:hypothetical protein
MRMMDRENLIEIHCKPICKYDNETFCTSNAHK